MPSIKVEVIVTIMTMVIIIKITLFGQYEYHHIVKKAAHDADGIPCPGSPTTPFLSSVIILAKHRRTQYV
jgi:hypothetical protein